MTRTWVFHYPIYYTLFTTAEVVLFRVLVVLWFVLNAMDALISRWALTHGIAVELNPIYQQLGLLEADILKAGAAVLVVFFVGAMRCRSALLSQALILSLVAWIGWINLLNLTVVGIR